MYCEENNLTPTCCEVADIYIYIYIDQSTFRYQRQMTPHSKLPGHRVSSLLFNVINESPFETVN